MKYELERENGKVTFTISYDAKEWEGAIEKAYQKNKNKYSHEGFRKGHVPRKILEQAYGEGIFYEDAINGLLSDTYPVVLEENKDVEPVASPDAELVEIKNGMKAKLFVTVKPDFELGQYKGFTLKKVKYPVKDEDVNAEIERAREKGARLVEVTDRASELGDILNIDYSGSIDGVKFDGGTAEKQNLELGSKTFIPGFEEQLVGMNKGDQKDITVKFPEDYGAQNLAGKDAVFAIKVNEISKKELPALDDEFAKDISEFDTFAEYKEDVKKTLVEKNTKKADEDMENALIDKIAESTQIEIPAPMLEEEIDQMIKQFEYRLMYQGMKLDDYLKYTGIKMEDIRKDYKDIATKNIKVRLIMDKIVEVEKIEATEDEVAAKVSEMAVKAGKPADTYKNDLQARQMDYIKNEIVMNKLLDFLKKESKYE